MHRHTLTYTQRAALPIWDRINLESREAAQRARQAARRARIESGALAVVRVLVAALTLGARITVRVVAYAAFLVLAFAIGAALGTGYTVVMRAVLG